MSSFLDAEGGGEVPRDTYYVMCTYNLHYAVIQHACLLCFNIRINQIFTLNVLLCLCYLMKVCAERVEFIPFLHFFVAPVPKWEITLKRILNKKFIYM